MVGSVKIMYIYISPELTDECIAIEKLIAEL